MQPEILSKECNKCQAKKPLTDFPVNRARGDGYDAACKICTRERNRGQYAKHAEKRRETAKQYKEEHGEERAAYMREYRIKNKDHLDAQIREWRLTHKTNRSPESKERSRQRRLAKYQTDPAYREKHLQSARKRRVANPEKIKEAYKLWVENNKDHKRKYHREYNKERRRRDPVFHNRSLEIKTEYRLRKWRKDELSNGSFRPLPEREIEPMYMRRLQSWQNGRCYICNREGTQFTCEHILPRSRGGQTVKQNIVRSCPDCNYSRQAKLLWLEWSPSIIDAQTDNHLVSFATVGAALTAAGIVWSSNPDSSFTLSHGDRQKRFCILSTFSGSDRNLGSASGRVIAQIKAVDLDSIVVFDHEWYLRRSAVINLLQSKLGMLTRVFGARELDIVEVDTLQSDNFMVEHHLMGIRKAPYRIGLTDGTTLYGLGLFTESNMGFECVRLAFKGHVPGGMSRITKALLDRYGKRPIKTFIDSRYASGMGHEAVGFQATGLAQETFLWVLPDRVQHQRYFSNDNKMSQNLLYFDPALSVDLNTAINGIYKIWIPPKLIMELVP